MQEINPTTQDPEKKPSLQRAIFMTLLWSIVLMALAVISVLISNVLSGQLQFTPHYFLLSSIIPILVAAAQSCKYAKACQQDK